MELLDAFRFRPVDTLPLRPDPVAPAHLKLLVECAARSPSHFNSQPWRFVIVRDATLRATLAERTAIPSLGDAPALLLIALDKSEYQVGELQGLYCEITLGAVIQSFWLTAHSLGLAMQWVKPALEQSAAKAAIIDQLGIPDTHDPVALFRLGYYQTPPVTASEPVHPFQTLIHADQWGNPAPAGLTDSPSLLWKPK